MSNPARKARGKAAQGAGAPAGARLAAQQVAARPVTAFAGDTAEVISTMHSGTPASIIPGLASRLGAPHRQASATVREVLKQQWQG